MGAKQVNPKITTIARIRDPDFFIEDEDDETSRGPFGIDFVIDPDHATAHDIAEAVLLPGAVSVEYFGDGRLGLAEVIVGEESPLVGTPLSKRERREPSYIVGWGRGGNAKLADGDDVLQVRRPPDRGRSARAPRPDRRPPRRQGARGARAASSSAAAGSAPGWRRSSSRPRSG